MTGDKNKPSYKTEELDKKIINDAVARLRKIANGNGIQAEAIKVKDSFGAIYHADAASLVTLNTKLLPLKKKPSKDKRVVEVKTLKDAEAHNTKGIEEATKDSGFSGYMLSFFKQKPGEGLGVNAKDLPVAKLSNAYVIKTPCERCNTQGRYSCTMCHGKKQSICRRCNGKKNMPCTMCNATGQINSPQGRVKCTQCHGMRFLACPACRATGVTACSGCNGQGVMTCSSCNGNGAIIQYAEANTHAQTNSVINVMAIPDSLKMLINKITLAKIVSGGHIDVKTQAYDKPKNNTEAAEQKRREEEDRYGFSFPPRLKSNQLCLLYHTKIPYAEVTLEIEGKQAVAKILGYKGVVAEMPPFLNNIVSRETIALEKRLSKGKIQKEMFEKSLQYRFMRKAWKLLQENKPKQAMAIFAKEYGAAIERPQIQALFHALHSAKNKLNRGTHILVALTALSAIGGAAWVIYTYSGLF